ncbi:MAG: POTRA domain-containing protein [Bacteroidia bacterium]
MPVVGHDAQVEYDTVYSHDDKTINLQLKVYEGEQYHYGDIRFAGNYKFNSEQLNQILGIQKGDIYNPSKLQKRLNGVPKGAISAPCTWTTAIFFPDSAHRR